MKKLIRTFVCAMMLVMIMGTSVFAAGGLKLVSSYPMEDSDGYEIVNLMVRLEFDKDMSGEKTTKANEKGFKVVDKKGKEQKILVLNDSKEKNRVNLILTGELKPKSDYKILIDGNVQSKDGSVLGKDQVINFATKDPSKDMTTTTIMMMGMMVLVVIFSIKSQKKQENVAESAKPKKVNPYKDNKKKK